MKKPLYFNLFIYLLLNTLIITKRDAGLDQCSSRGFPMPVKKKKKIGYIPNNKHDA